MQRTLLLRQTTTSAYALEADILSEGKQKYSQAMSDDTGSEWVTQNFCNYHQSLSQLRDIIHLSSTSPHAGLWIPSHAFRWARLGEGESPGNHCANHPRFSPFSSQNKSICARTAAERCRPRLRRMPYNKGPLNHDDQCSCHLSNHPRHARPGVIHHRCVSPPRSACRYSPWAAAVGQLPWFCTEAQTWTSIRHSALLKSGERLRIMIMILPMT